MEIWTTGTQRARGRREEGGGRRSGARGCWVPEAREFAFLDLVGSHGRALSRGVMQSERKLRWLSGEWIVKCERGSRDTS